MKKININFRKLQNKSKGSSWQKAVLLSLTVGTILIALSYAYLAIRPLSHDIKDIIDGEISAVDINFNQIVIEGIKERQKPAEIKATTSGKNPFAGF